MLPSFLPVQWANIFLSVNAHNTWLLYETSSHYSMIFLYLNSYNLSPMRSLFSTTTKYFTQQKYYNYKLLLFLKHFLLNTTNLSSTLDLRQVKNYNFSPNYSNVLLLVGSFCNIKHCKYSKLFYFDQPYFQSQ